MTTKWQMDFLDVLLTYRMLVGQANAITLNPQKNQQAQDCALMMHANRPLSHHPNSSWLCYTQDGAFAASQSCLAGTAAIRSVGLYVRDPGPANADTLGHRRWIFSNRLGDIGIGSTDRASCLVVTNGNGAGNKEWIAWPPNGVCPFTALNADVTGWSVQSDTLDVRNAHVQVTEYPDAIVRSVTGPVALLPNYGSAYAVAFFPNGWSTQANKTYSVALTMVNACVHYISHVVDCDALSYSVPTAANPPSAHPTHAPSRIPSSPPSKKCKGKGCKKSGK
jgi:hypothetical protein